jgi:hypothetical protein
VIENGGGLSPDAFATLRRDRFFNVSFAWLLAGTGAGAPASDVLVTAGFITTDSVFPCLGAAAVGV